MDLLSSLQYLSVDLDTESDDSQNFAIDLMNLLDKDNHKSTYTGSDTDSDIDSIIGTDTDTSTDSDMAQTQTAFTDQDSQHGQIKSRQAQTTQTNVWIH